MSTRDLINAIESGDSVAIQQSFQQEMASRIADRLDDMRIEVAKNMFNEAACKTKMKSEEEMDDEEEMDEALRVMGSDDWKKGASRPSKNPNDADVTAKRNEIASQAKKARSSGSFSGNQSKDTAQVGGGHVRKYNSASVTKEELTLEDYSPEEIEEFMQTEDFEQLDELSKKTLGNYIKKASSSSDERSNSNLASRAANKAHTVGMDGPGDDDDGEKDDRKSFMRSKGIAKAVDKLTK